MFSGIPQNRLIGYIMLLGIFPFCLVLFDFFNRQTSIDEVSNSIQQVYALAGSKEKKQAINNAVRANYRDADHFYIDKHLETHPLLEPERESLEKVLTNKNFPDDENIKKRFDFLSGTSNDIIFTEGAVQSTPLFQETTETLAHPIEVNVADVRSILSKIEGSVIGEEKPQPNRPQLIILDFKLEKKTASEGNEIFLLNMKLLKREFL